MSLIRAGCGAETPRWGGRAKIENSFWPQPQKFAAKRFLALCEVAGAEVGWPILGYLLGKNFRRCDRDHLRSAQEDGCSSLPCRGVLSFRSEARETSGNETPRVHHVARRRGGMAALAARAQQPAMR